MRCSPSRAGVSCTSAITPSMAKFAAVAAWLDSLGKLLGERDSSVRPQLVAAARTLAMPKSYEGPLRPALIAVAEDGKAPSAVRLDAQELAARFARELHDGAVQSLIAVEMQVDVLRRQAEAGRVDFLSHVLFQRLSCRPSRRCGRCPC